MNDYVEIVLRRNRGWPWPEDSYGLTPMFGEDGWCHSCGVPEHAQTGSLVLQRKGLKIEGAWVPNWQFDAYCVAPLIAGEAAGAFGLTVRQIKDPHGGDLGARQVVVESSSEAWFRPADLRGVITPIHGKASETCVDCGVTRWMPVGMDVLPPPPQAVFARSPAVVASPEYFGAGKQSFRQILWRRDVADFLVAVSPRDLRIQAIGG